MAAGDPDPPAFGRLLIVSHTPHHRRGDEIVAFEPTTVEIDHLAPLFAEVRHVAPLHDGPAPPASVPPRAPNVTLVPVRPAGGAGPAAKLGVLGRVPGWYRTIRREAAAADVVHVRAPANLALVALAARPRPLWLKYAGDWHGSSPYASYRLQRRWARRARGRVRVTVNGRRTDDPGHVVAFDNPSLTDDDRTLGAERAAAKDLTEPLHLVFAGRVEEAKGPHHAIDAVAELETAGVAAELTLVGDGPAMDSCRRRAVDRGVDDRVRLAGWTPRARLLEELGRAHLVLLPTAASEGWPKVLSEAMAFGAVSVTTDVSAVRSVLDDVGAGTITAADGPAVAGAIRAYLDAPDRWRAERDRGVAAAGRFTYATHVARVRTLLDGLVGTR